VDSDKNQDQATDQEELGPQDDDVISPQALKDDFLPELPTQEPTLHKTPTAAPTPEQTSEPPTIEPPTQDETPAGTSGPLTQRTIRPEAVPKE
jgi:hypothetical protein